jgi:hypothetical protein
LNRLVLAEVRDRLLLTKRKYEDLVTQGKVDDAYNEYPPDSGTYEFAAVRRWCRASAVLYHFVTVWLSRLKTGRRSE